VATDGDEVAYVGTDAGYLYAVGADGEVRWQSDLGGPVNTTPAVVPGTVYATTPERVVAVNAAAGTGRWSGRVEHVAKTGLSVGGGMVHVGGNEVAAFDASDGTPRWRVELPGVAGTFGSPLYVDGTLYAGGCVKIDGSSRYDHTVWALE
jgi:outer membrane protein assembly factor BamB